jgi:dipeptidyl aminopeptidase/acylaminoacyl peptidase
MSINATALYPWLQAGNSSVFNAGKPIREYARLPYVTLTSSYQLIETLNIELNANSLINDWYIDRITTALSGLSSPAKRAKFSSDGTFMFVLDPSGTSATIFRYALSIPYDPSSWSSSQSFDFSSTTGTVKDFCFSPDGTKLLVHGANFSNAIFEYSLSTAWSLSTLTYTSRNFSTNTQDTNMKDIRISPDGLRLILLGDDNKRLYRYNLGSYANLTTVTYIEQLSLSSYLVNPNSSGSIQSGMAINRDGTRIYIPYNAGSSDIYGAIKEIVLSSAFTLSGAVVGLTQRGGIFGSSSQCIFDFGPTDNNGETPCLMYNNTIGGVSGNCIVRAINTNKTNLFVHGVILSSRGTARIYYNGHRFYTNNNIILPFPPKINDYVDRYSLYEASGSNGRVSNFLPLNLLGQGNTKYSLEIELAASPSITNELLVSTLYSVF